MGSLNEDAWKNLANAATMTMPLELGHRNFYSEMARKMTWDSRLNDARMRRLDNRQAVAQKLVAMGIVPSVA